MKHGKRKRHSEEVEQATSPLHAVGDGPDLQGEVLHMPLGDQHQPVLGDCPRSSRSYALHPTDASTAAATAPITPKVEDFTAAPEVTTTMLAIEEKSMHAAANHKQFPIHQASAHTQNNTMPSKADAQLKEAAAATQFQGNVKRVRDAESFQRQKERRQKKAAFLLDGTTTGPVVGVAKGGSWGHAAQQHAIRMQNGQMVQLPVRPNRYRLELSKHRQHCDLRGKADTRRGHRHPLTANLFTTPRAYTRCISPIRCVQVSGVTDAEHQCSAAAEAPCPA